MSNSNISQSSLDDANDILKDPKLCNPFIHKFETTNYKYIFDANSMQIFRVNPIVWDIILDHGVLSKDEIASKYSKSYSVSEVLNAYAEITKFQDNHFLLSKRPKRIGMPFDRQYIEDQLTSQRMQLCLNVTEDCNFKCKYCLIHGDQQIRPSNTDRYMSWEVAQKAIDHFLQSNTKSTYKCISFYGGEPLLNFDLIRKCVEYTKDRNVGYAITTNASLLNGAIADYLAVHDFIVTVSLDGPQECHDRFRRFKNGSSTWDTVTKNLDSFISLQQKYGHTLRVTVNCVLVPPVNMVRLEEYFTFLAETKQLQIRVGGVNTRTDGVPQLSTEDIDQIRKQFVLNLQKGMINESSSNPKFAFQLSLFGKLFLGLHKRFTLRTLCKPCHDKNYWSFPDECSQITTCIPGTRRTFVSVDGDYWPCERVQNSEYLKIGNIKQGFNVDKIQQLLSDWINLTRYECKRCWCLPLCAIPCWAGDICAEGPNKTEKISACARERTAKHHLLIAYCSVLEKNPHAFDYMEHIDVI